MVEEENETTTIEVYNKDKTVFDDFKLHPRESNKEAFHRLIKKFLEAV